MDSAFAAMTGPPAPAVTFAPLLNNVVHLAADMDACNTVADHVLECADSLGGLTNIFNVPEEDLIACVCCDSGTLLADGYSSCYDYLTDAPGYAATDYEPYGVFYTVCNAEGSCAASGTTATTTEEDDASMTTMPDSDEGPVTATVSIDVTTIASEDYMPTTTEPAECWDMISMFDACEAETAGFSTMPFAAQASCYCCGSSGQWTDEIDSSASVCADWASTGEPYTVYPVATRFATFCDDYDDVCESQETEMPTVTDDDEDNELTSTGDEDSEEDNEPIDTGDEDVEEPPDNRDAAVSVRVGYGAAAVAALALGMVI
ncbi:uncharacterized protein J7T54_001985 [Emericellopsis cladophorae]|uniref:Uncharacterized protein n=1 Tax=Emericellopsis cladophorae TaxID=2686198 RepID=A0A9Q0BBK9_9HYPO|nr:uncharacterized protein J7T54_001985 [Emericellopsis cladophorae]KAI6779897.1 hypothetical protein J7T54_001985 [Emericellopsis cladophorae]